MKIVVLAGGISSERDVSYSSGKKIYYALKKRGHKVILIDVYFGISCEVDNIFDLDYDWGKDICEIGETAPIVENIKAKRNNCKSAYFGENVIEICNKSDLVFLALHGENGENGKVQATFDLLGIKYTGTDYLGSALAMNKGLSKELFQHHGIMTPKYYKHSPHDSVDNFTYPKVVKVSCGGSSIGVYIVHNEEEYNSAILEAKMIDREILIEEYIEGREFSVGIIDGKALPVIEIIPKAGFYNYKNKYQSGNTIEICPADISHEKTLYMQKIAEKAYQILRLKIYARIDFIMCNKNGEIYCLEANTLPGMTPTSLIPQEAKAMGIDYPSLCEKIIELSIK